MTPAKCVRPRRLALGMEVVLGREVDLRDGVGGALTQSFLPAADRPAHEAASDAAAQAERRESQGRTALRRIMTLVLLVRRLLASDATHGTAVTGLTCMSSYMPGSFAAPPNCLSFTNHSWTSSTPPPPRRCGRCRPRGPCFSVLVRTPSLPRKSLTPHSGALCSTRATQSGSWPRRGTSCVSPRTLGRKSR